jgi:hypothetical protein
LKIKGFRCQVSGVRKKSRFQVSGFRNKKEKYENRIFNCGDFKILICAETPVFGMNGQ